MQLFQIILLLLVAHIIEVLFWYYQEVIVVTLTEKAGSLTAVSAFGLIINTSYSAVIKITDGLGDFITIVITNEFERQISLSFASNTSRLSSIGNPLAITLLNQSLTHYVFLTGWAGRINVGPNINPLGSKIEGSFMGLSNIDVSYMNGYSVPITCFSRGTAVSGCNIDLFKQMHVVCINKIEGPVCLNPAQTVPNSSALPFLPPVLELPTHILMTIRPMWVISKATWFLVV